MLFYDLKLNLKFKTEPRTIKMDNTEFRKKSTQHFWLTFGSLSISPG